MKIRTRGLLLASFVALFLFAGIAPVFADKGESCTQGYFATLFCERAKLEPNKQWNDDDAIARLKVLGIEPLDGWKKDEALTEGTMVLLLRFVDIPVFSTHQERVVTVLEARAVFDRIQRRLIERLPALLVLDGGTATTIDFEGHEAPTLSP